MGSYEQAKEHLDLFRDRMRQVISRPRAALRAAARADVQAVIDAERLESDVFKLPYSARRSAGGPL